jgi:hypothetical protein
MKKIDAERYHPLYFLSSLGAGGLAISFFVYFLFLVEHPDTPLVTFDDLAAAWQAADWPIRGLMVAGLSGLLALSLLHYRLLVWNLIQYRRYRHSEAFAKLRRSSGEIALMAIPLTLAMSINVIFVVGAVFVPGLWDFVEYLFPIALIGFLAVGFYALKLYGTYLSRMITTGTFDSVANASLSQLVPIFTFAMIAVGFAAPGAMSREVEVNAIGIFLSIFFLSLAMLLGFVKLVLGMGSMLRHGLDVVASPSIWIVIPILTLFGIAAIRLTMGLHHGFEAPVSHPGLFVLTSSIFSLEILFGMIGYVVMRQMGYFRYYLLGDKTHPGAYALVCPGVAFFVFGMFWIMFGLVQNGLVERLSLIFVLLMLPLTWVQFKSLTTLLRLNRKLLTSSYAAMATSDLR